MLTLSCYDSVSIVTEWCNHRNVIVTLLSEVMMINSRRVLQLILIKIVLTEQTLRYFVLPLHLNKRIGI